MTSAATTDHETLKLFHSQIAVARRPEDFFRLKGSKKDELLAELQSVYLKHVRKFHPDNWGKDARLTYLANEITATLNALRVSAIERIEGGVWGASAPFPSDAKASVHEIKTRNRIYRVRSCLATGDLADVYAGDYDETDGSVQPVCIKVARDKADGPRMIVERDLLQTVKHKSLPVWVESFKTTDSLTATVTRRIDGEDLYALLERRKVEQRDFCWIMLRLLSVLGYLHSNGILHGHIEPGNVLIRGRDHNGFLIGLTAAVRPGEKFTWLDEHYSAPEVAQRKPPIPPSDLWSLGKCGVFILGGDPAGDRIPDVLEDTSLRRFLGRLLDPNPLRRAGDAWEEWHALTGIRNRIYGTKRDFVPFR